MSTCGLRIYWFLFGSLRVVTVLTSLVHTLYISRNNGIILFTKTNILNEEAALKSNENNKKFYLRLKNRDQRSKWTSRSPIK